MNELYDIGKTVCVVSGQLQLYFGILKDRNHIPTTNREYWIIDIHPAEYKPTDYTKIEDSCYQ